MKILFYGINFSPELTGTGKYNGELIRWLTDKGHSCEVITAMPFYPEWKIKDEYKGRGWFKELKDGITVYRVPLYIPSNVTGRTRIIHELSFGFNSLWFWLRCFFRRYDIVIGVCPPLQIAIFPYLYSKIHKKPFLFHVQDLQVDAAQKLNLINNKRLIKVLESVERYLLKNATFVSSISEGMKNNILNKGVRESQYIMLKNWVNTDFLKPIPKDITYKKSLGIDERASIILYSGNLGEKQGLEVLISVAKILEKRDDIIIVICGEGAAKKSLFNLLVEHKLFNVVFIPVQKYDNLPKLLSIADIHLVIQKKAASDIVMPSKLSGILSVGGLSIITVQKESSFARLINSHHMGITIEPENELLLADSIINTLQLDNNTINTMRKNAREYALQYLEKEVLLNEFNVLINLINKGLK